MRFLLDTNVISALRRPARQRPRPLQRWFTSVDENALHLSELVLGEIKRGIELKRRHDPRQADHLLRWYHELLQQFDDRLIPLDMPAIELWAQADAERSYPLFDSLIAASAATRGMTLVTRDVRDLRGFPVELLDPFNENTLHEP